MYLFRLMLRSTSFVAAVVLVFMVAPAFGGETSQGENRSRALKVGKAPGQTQTEEGERPLRLALAGEQKTSTVASSSPPTTPRDAFASIIASGEGKYVWVSARDKHDALMEIRTSRSKVSKSEMIEGTLKSDFLPQQEQRTAPNAAALEPLFRLALQRAYLIANLDRVQANDITVQLALKGSPDGAAPILRKNQQVSFTFSAPVDGFLTLINVDCDGNLNLLFPQPGESNQVSGGTPLIIGDHLPVHVTAPFGPEYVKAVFTTVPLDVEPDLMKFIGKTTRSLGRGGLQAGVGEVHFTTVEK